MVLIRRHSSKIDDRCREASRLISRLSGFHFQEYENGKDIGVSRFCYVLRKGNKLANYMAKCSSCNDLICHRFLLPPDAVKFQLEEDFCQLSSEEG
ncbi:hypothetical protein V6N12_029372 [Hibiscus sabdariffa]|uniref:RNase H type-1 domain-containing protein n=1 Tax=Hibiscus sabdariffa TaxID=183260 RepID=A0ABR2CVY6_9ROSI